MPLIVMAILIAPVLPVAAQTSPGPEEAPPEVAWTQPTVPSTPSP